jgi:hypothetical protein
LLLRIVCALPNASRIGLACRICFSSRPVLGVLTKPFVEPERTTDRVEAERARKLDDDDEGEIAASEAIAARY